jgi:type IV pilus assembly protein PilC
MGLKLNQIESSVKRDSSMSLDDILKKEITLFGNSFSSKKKEQFYVELGVLLQSGIRLKDALSLMSESQKKKKDAELFFSMSEDIVQGKDFSAILRDDKNFTDYEQYSIGIGEQTGTLQKVTTSLAEFYSRKNEQRRNMISALTYPAIVLTTAVLAVTFMLQFVVPMFKDVFAQNNVDLPAITKGVIAVSEGMGAYGWVLFLLSILVFVLGKLYSKKKWYRSWRDRLVLKLPLIGGFAKTAQIARFTQAVSLLVSAKVSIPESIKLAREMIDFIPLEDVLIKAESDLLRGLSLSESFKNTKFFDNKMIALVRVAEETNQTEFVFSRLNEQYSAEVLQKSKTFSTILEPLIILIVGVLVAVILISMYLPMFELGNVLK